MKPSELKQIKKELGEISKYPWDIIFSDNESFGFCFDILKEVVYNKEAQKIDLNFISQAPERISKLIARIEELENLIKGIKMASEAAINHSVKCGKDRIDYYLNNSEEDL